MAYPTPTDRNTRGPLGQRSILLVAPTRPEYAVVRAALAKCSSHDVELAACGVGPAASAALCHQIERRASLPDVVALVGWAGGLDPTLAPGDIIVGESALDGRGARAPCSVAHLPGASVGPVLTLSQPLLTAESKRAARRSGALAVEMEAYPLAVWARSHGLPFYHARVVLDAAEESLPDLGDALDEMAQVRWAQLARALLVRPDLALSLLQLAHRTLSLRPALSRLARALIQAF